MLKKAIVSITILAMILTLASVSVVGAKGGKPTETPPPIPTEIPDTGELYGDLYVVLRDENGVPILRDETLVDPESGGDIVVSCIQPISTVTDSITIPTFYGELTINAIEGEPFSLASYIDLAGDLVECELTVIMDGDTIISDMTTWVQAVDFGRLSLGRAPDAVIAHGLDEAIIKLNSSTAIYLDPAGRLVLSLPDETTGDTIDKTIDAPAENLALYIKMMLDGHWITLDTTQVEPGGGGGSGGGPPDGKGPPEGDGPSSEPRPVLDCFVKDADGNNTTTPTSLNINLTTLGYGGLCDETRTNATLTNGELQLAASLLAAAADKTGTFSLDMVIYINSVYGINQAEPGTIPGEVAGKTYFDFGNFDYGAGGAGFGRGAFYGERFSGTCAPGWVWVLQPDDETYINFTAQCMEILGYDPDTNPLYNAVRFNNFVEDYAPPFINYPYDANVRGFAQAADDALQVIEYIHNYKVPEDLYAE